MFIRQILGALKLAAQQIQVRGIVSLPPDQAWLLPELESGLTQLAQGERLNSTKVLPASQN